MKKNNLAEFFKSKGYYVLLFVGIIAIAVVALIGSNLSSNQTDDNENLVDLNEPDNYMLAEDNTNLQADNNDTSDQFANIEQAPDLDVIEGGQDVVDNDSLLEFDVYTEDEENGIGLVETVNKPTEVADVVQNVEEEEESLETTSPTVKNLPSLSFDAEEGLIWPVDGNVIMNYSMEHLTYHATLMQFKVNPAIIIDAEVGTEVKAAADGVIADIYDDPVTGLTVAMDIGNEYSLVYGQIKDVDFKIGDSVSEGDVIGAINEPTKYYTVEGSNLYFMVMESDQTVNPMLLLQDMQ